MADEIPEKIGQFIAENFNSVEQLEALLLLRTHPDKDWDAVQLSQALYTQPEAAALRLADLKARGFLTTADGPTPRYRYRPAPAELASLVDALAEVYRERRVTVITLIYSRPVDPAQAFADAFRLRKER
jgi:hypothetical protein